MVAMNFKWKLRLGIAVTTVITALLFWWAWRTFPHGYVIISAILVVVVGGAWVDANVSRKLRSPENNEQSD